MESFIVGGGECHMCKGYGCVEHQSSVVQSHCSLGGAKGRHTISPCDNFMMGLTILINV